MKCFNPPDDGWPVSEELVLQEFVCDEPRSQDDHEVELLAEEEAHGVAVVLVVEVFLSID